MNKLCAKARALKNTLDKEGVDFRWSEHYSGRCMYGRVSEVAFVCDVHPDSKLGMRIRMRDFLVDNMGRDWVYYTFTSKPEEMQNDQP